MLQPDSEMEHQESKLLESNPTYTESKQRVAKVIGVILLNGALAINASGFSLASDQVAQLYALSPHEVQRFNLTFPGVLTLGSLIFALFLSFVSIRYGILLSTLLTIVGSVLRSLVNQKYTFLVVGQHFLALGYCLSRNLFTHVSSRYFFPKNRVFITGLIFSFNAFFLVLGAFIPVFTIPVSQIAQQDEEHYRWRVKLQYAILAPIMTIVSLVSLYLLWDQGETKSSPTSEMPRLQLYATCNQLFRKASFVLLAIFNSLSSGVFWAFLLVAHTLELRQHSNSLTILFLCAISIPLVFTLNSILTLHAGRQARFKAFLIPLSLIILVVLFLFLMLQHFNSLFVLGAVVILLTLSCSTSEVMATELAAQIGFPAAQTFTQSVLTSGSSICMLILINFQAHLFQKKLQHHFQWMLVLSALLGSLLVLFVKEKAMRRHTDWQFLRYGRGELEVE